MKLTVLTLDEKLAEIRRLYYRTTRNTIKEDFARALLLIKSIDREEDRERAAVYMDGLSQMRSDWLREWKNEGRGRKGDGEVRIEN